MSKVNQNLITKELLYQKLIVEKKSATEVGAEFNISKTSIHRLARKYKISISKFVKINIGEIYGNLEVIEIKNNRVCVCKCVCGNIKEVKSWFLRDKVVKSCGCLIREGKDSPHWCGKEEISGSILNSIIGGAKSRNLEFTITVEYMWDLFLKQNRKCALSGVDIKFGKRNGIKENNTASLDRIDSTKGYILGNVQWVHKDVNRMKQHYSQDYFINFVRLIAENFKEDKKVKRNPLA